MAAVTESVDVDVPLHTAYLQWTRFEEYPRFMDGVEEVVRLDAHHHYWKTYTAGVTREFGTETEELPDEHVSWRTVSDEPRHHALVTFRAVDADHTTIDVVTEVEPEGLTETTPPFTATRVRPDLLRFKELVETRALAEMRDTPGPTERGRIPPG
ncbi:SRPBCC family protein [Embleya hyalina]|uniref:Cyclase n=1 Tax=Embleya hyalina TaxID=516124 RepID=A0A401YDI2_9ACTN|nr:SRPBCC family protein [Embleya hyalina]GCD92650.1 cyclase [Embleya hyalina]